MAPRRATEEAESAPLEPRPAVNAAEGRGGRESLRDSSTQRRPSSNRPNSTPRQLLPSRCMHSAKGLEFPAVFIIGSRTGFPAQSALEDHEMGAERRCSTFAITRAERYSA